MEEKEIRVSCAVKQRGLFLAIFRVVKKKPVTVERLNKRFPVFCLLFVITFCCIFFVSYAFEKYLLESEAGI